MDNNRQVGSDTQKVEVFNIEDGKRVTLDHDPQVIRNTPDYVKYREDLDEIFDYWKNDPDGRVSLFSTFNKKTNVDEELLSLAAKYFGEDKEVLRAVEEDEVEPRRLSQFRSYLEGIKKGISKLDKPKFVLELILGSNYKYIEDEGEPEEKEVHMFVDAKNKGNILELAIEDYLTGVNYSPVSEVESDNGKITPEPIVSNSDDTAEIDKGLVQKSMLNNEQSETIPLSEISEAQQKELTSLYASADKLFTELAKSVAELNKKDPLRLKYRGKDYLESAALALEELDRMVDANKFVGVSVESADDLKKRTNDLIKNLKNWKNELETESHPNTKRVTNESTKDQTLVVEKNKKGGDDGSGENKEKDRLREEIQEFLEGEDLKGLMPDKMRQYFINGKYLPDYYKADDYVARLMKDNNVWQEEVRKFLIRVEKGNFDPAFELLTKTACAVAKLDGDEGRNEFEKKPLEERDALRRQAMKKLFNHVAYSGKWRVYKDQPQLQDDRDLDVIVSLWLAKKAGFDNKEKNVVMGDNEVYKGIMFDAGGFSGPTMAVSQSWSPDKSPIELEQQPNQVLLALDNHQHRHGLETSAAYQAYRLFKAGGWLKESANVGDAEKDKFNTWALQVLVDLANKDDNGELITNVYQFMNSSRTLRGLAGQVNSIDNIYDYIVNNLENKTITENNFEEFKKDLYNQTLSDSELGSFGLKYKNVDKTDFVSRKIAAAKKLFYVDIPRLPDEDEEAYKIRKAGELIVKKRERDEKLEAAGRLVRVPYQQAGKKVELKFIIMVQDFDDAMYFVDKQGKRRDAVDHNVVRAFEDFTGLIKFSPQIGSFVVNTVRKEAPPIHKLLGNLEQRRDVRGVMGVKPSDTRELTVTLREA